MIIKDFYWFWKDWTETSTLLDNPYIVKKLFNQNDYRYIQSTWSFQIDMLWLKLDRLKYLYLPKKKREYRKSRPCRLYIYKWKEYTIYELSKLSWITHGTLYTRMHQRWVPVNIAMKK